MIDRKAIKRLRERLRKGWIKRTDRFNQEWNTWKKNNRKTSSEQMKDKRAELLKKYNLDK